MSKDTVDDNRSVFFASYSTVMSVATGDAWISGAMKMLAQTSMELYNHTINVALLTACIARVDGKRSYDPHEAVLGALLHDIGYVWTNNRAWGKPVSEMTDMERLSFENHIRSGTDYITGHVSSQTVRDIVAMHHEYLDGSGFPGHLTAGQIPRHARIVAVVNEFVNQLSYQTRETVPESLTDAGDRMNVLVEGGKIDAEILGMLYGQLGETSRLLTSITSVLLS